LGAQMVKGPNLVALRRGGDRSKEITAFRVIESNPPGFVVEVNSAGASGLGIDTRYRVRPDQPIVGIEPGDGTEGVFVEAPGRYAVLPDVFAGDLVVRAVDAAA